MAIAGTIERTSPITLPRVLERIFDHEQPGLLRLKHKESGRSAEVKIDRGAVQETVFGELNGDQAMKEISQTFPWEYEFVSSDTSITTGRLPAQLTTPSGKRPALKLVGAVKPMMILSGQTGPRSEVSPTVEKAKTPDPTPPEPQVTKPAEAKPASRLMQAKNSPAPRPTAAKPGQAPAAVVQATATPTTSAPQSKAAAVPAPASPPSPLRRMSSLPTAESLADWVADGDEYALRFVIAEDRNIGNVAESEMAYFRADAASLMERASLIGDVLGFSPPSLAALVESERAAAYRRLADGFAGIYSGPGSTVDSMLSIP